MRKLTTWCLLLLTWITAIGLRPIAADSGPASLVRQSKWTRDGHIEPLVQVWSETFPVLGKDLYYNPDNLGTLDRAAVIPPYIPLVAVMVQGNIGGTQGTRNLEKKAIVMALYTPTAASNDPLETYEVLAAQDSRTERVKSRNLKDLGFNSRQIERQTWTGVLKGVVPAEKVIPGRKFLIRITRNQSTADAIDMWFVVSNNRVGVAQGGTPSPQTMAPTTSAPGFAPQGNLPPQPFAIPGEQFVTPQGAAAGPGFQSFGGTARLYIRFQDRQGQPCQGPWRIQIVGYDTNGAQVFEPHELLVNNGVAAADVPCGLWYTVRVPQSQGMMWTQVNCPTSRKLPCSQQRIDGAGGTIILRKR